MTIGERDGTYVRYDDIRRSTLAGHDMEVVVFAENCDLVEGDPIDLSGMVSMKKMSSRWAHLTAM